MGSSGVMRPHVNQENPFLGKTIYPNPIYTQNVKTTESHHPEVQSLLQKVENIGAATWIDTIAHIDLIEPILTGAKAAGQVPMLIIYDLPNRDCDANASNGEIECEDHQCA